MNRKNIRREAKAYVLITVGLAIYALAWVIFLIPHHLVGGGVSGVGALVEYATGFRMSYTYFIVNAVLLLMALKILGRGFGAKTVYAIFINTLFFRLFPDVVPVDFIREIALDNGKLLSAMIGGVMTGAGVGIALMQGGSSGGTDMVAMMVGKYRNISPGKIILSIDMVIIACSFFVSHETSAGHKLAAVLYGYMIVGLSGYTIDLILSGARQSLQFFIFSKNHERIAERITKDMHRGVTILNGTGWHTKTESKIVMVIARKTESSIIFNIIKDEDRDAFLSVGNVMGVYGNGFERIRS
ncbi:MAG: YitT family protein [Prevotellaceae bacterium]|jgi:uncharacterized membrane-anchored protein YitT (DUF2179 family)|nr:YitT family protein [Prevotellaceae bacterium]